MSSVSANVAQLVFDANFVIDRWTHSDVVIIRHRVSQVNSSQLLACFATRIRSQPFLLRDRAQENATSKTEALAVR